VKPLRGSNLSTLSGNVLGNTTFSAFGLNQAMIGSTTDLQQQKSKMADDFIFSNKTGPANT